MCEHMGSLDFLDQVLDTLEVLRIYRLSKSTHLTKGHGITII